MSGPSRAHLGRRQPFKPHIVAAPRSQRVAHVSPMNATSTLDPPAPCQDTKAFIKTSSSTMSVYIEEPGYNPTLYPSGVKRPYRLVVVDSGGTQYGELVGFKINNVKWELNGLGALTFTINADNPLSSMLKVAEREVQLWRGTKLVWWGVLTRVTADTANRYLQVSCKLLGWYFTRRHFGRAGRTNMLYNGDFEDGYFGAAYWCHFTTMYFLSFLAHDTANVRSVYAGDGGIAPAPLLGNKVLKITNPDYSASGLPQWWGDSVYEFLFQDVVVSGGANGRKVIFSAWCYVPSSTYVRPDFKERGMLLARMPYYSGNNLGSAIYKNINGQGSPGVTYFNTGAFGSNTYRNLYTEARQVKTTQLNLQTPKDKWQRHTIEIDVPANTTEVIHARLEGVIGATFWDAATLVVDEQFENNSSLGDDQAELALRMMYHAQGYPNASYAGKGSYDASYDKSDLNINGSQSSCPPTGIKRFRSIRYTDHSKVFDSINEFPTLYDGLDWDITYPTPTTRQFNTYYPQKGTVQSNLVLELGKNMIGCMVDLDGENTSNVVIIIGDGDDASRPEAGAKDLSVFASGLSLETIFHSTPGSLMSTLSAQATRALTKLKRPIIVPQVAIWDIGGHLFDRLQVGDIHPVRINYGYLNINENYRIVAIDLDPNTEVVTLTLNQVFS